MVSVISCHPLCGSLLSLFRSWYHPPPPNTCILPITWQLSPLIFTNLLPSQPPGLTLTVPPQKCLPCLPLSLQWLPLLSVMLSL